MTTSVVEHLIAMFGKISTAIDDAVDELSELDGAIGDADHGITMVLGFHAVTAALQSARSDLSSASAVMNAAATAFLNAVGASTGPLYATGLRRAAQSLDGVEKLDQSAATAMLTAIPAGIRERGKAQRGDKTMLDAWLPASEAAALALANGADRKTFWKQVVAAAEHGAEATRSMVAAKGRAARVGGRSLGHMDPGAASTVIIIKAMAEALSGDDA
ncbi:dihydroxyacetone kinase-like protein [Rhodobium orientis]|uniref:Dihydroxyacetone kinase subunit L n=1 Tax=Rhodobium orientis TaxID=34017 RepID=A0A327JPZ9_9HYPH|nr:dihydroxyacetone kinase subunit DhaL [Rhodobium orientis]MBB4301396.1 dihydroxyacetone kinase-like protein [Rhodobium orientis]MBK5951016.1 dihydroxyacetone kinase subunit L [Rhodobium orientis]RAI27656.1 dihydroxyacetone kinase subunit L [Rhodobium orientis]